MFPFREQARSQFQVPSQCVERASLGQSGGNAAKPRERTKPQIRGKSIHFSLGWSF